MFTKTSLYFKFSTFRYQVSERKKILALYKCASKPSSIGKENLTFVLLELYFVIAPSNLTSENYVTELGDLHMQVQNNLLPLRVFRSVAHLKNSRCECERENFCNDALLC